MYSIKSFGKVRIARVVGLIVFFLFTGLSFAQEFSYERIDENNLEFKAGGEIFSFDGGA